MIVTDAKTYPGISFEDYLKLPGTSYSGIKSEGRPVKESTGKMSLGTEVHNYLLYPSQYRHGNPVARCAAIVLKGTLGNLIKLMHPELSVTSKFCYSGMEMAYKGRIDLAVPGKLVIDLKITASDIMKTIMIFGYHHQLSGYALAIGARRAIIVAVHPKTLKVQVVPIHIEEGWWERQVVSRGEYK